MSPRVSSLLRGAAKALAFVAITLVTFELVLQLAGWYARGQLERASEPAQRTQRVRILVLGDSNTYGLYLEPADAYPAQLEALWNRDHDPDLEVVNMGYPGTNSSTVVAHLEKAVATFRPDLVLIMIGVNDYWTVPLGGGIESGSGPASLLDALRRHSRVYKLLALLLGAGDAGESRGRFVLDPTRMTGEHAAKLEHDVRSEVTTEGTLGEDVVIDDQRFDFRYRFRGPSDPQTSGAATIEANLRRIVEMARALDVDVLFLTYASDRDFYQRANRAVRGSLARLRYPGLVDVTASFDCSDATACEEYFFPDQHATAKGNTVIAKTLVAALARRFAAAERAAEAR